MVTPVSRVCALPTSSRIQGDQELLVIDVLLRFRHAASWSAAMPPYRVCGSGFEGAWRAEYSRSGRRDGTVDALSARSA
ncbi:hypothetical protein PJI17_11850 [Mycobacterium kansasii]|nr:hypothetical protein I547_1594 [Mycobacterium kansasii 824]